MQPFPGIVTQKPTEPRAGLTVLTAAISVSCGFSEKYFTSDHSVHALHAQKDGVTWIPLLRQ
jgi:hypothetical protein